MKKLQNTNGQKFLLPQSHVVPLFGSKLTLCINFLKKVKDKRWTYNGALNIYTINHTLIVQLLKNDVI